jgi:hypothetical protein
VKAPSLGATTLMAEPSGFLHAMGKCAGSATAMTYAAFSGYCPPAGAVKSRPLATMGLSCANSATADTAWYGKRASPPSAVSTLQKFSKVSAPVHLLY